MLSEAVRSRCTKLERLSVAHNALAAAGVAALAAEVRRATCKLNHLNLSDVQLHLGCQPVLQRLGSAQAALQLLDLSWNRLLSDGVAVLARALAGGGLPLLRTLNLSFVGADDAVAGALASVISRHTELRQLDVSGNRLGPGTGAAIAEALVGNSLLAALRVGFNPLGEGGVHPLLRCLAHNHALALLGLENTLPTASSQMEALEMADRIMRARPRLAHVLLCYADSTPLLHCDAARADATPRAL